MATNEQKQQSDIEQLDMKLMFENYLMAVKRLKMGRQVLGRYSNEATDDFVPSEKV